MSARTPVGMHTCRPKIAPVLRNDFRNILTDKPQMVALITKKGPETDIHNGN